jgi:hypothetical protein
MGSMFVLLARNLRSEINLGEATWADLTLEETRNLFESIALACERQEVVELRMSNVTWTTDGRLHPRNPDRISVHFSGALGSGSIQGLSRRQFLSACTEFLDVFGSMPNKNNGVSKHGH